MRTQHSSETPRPSMRWSTWFDRLIRAGTVVLVALTAVAVPLLVLITLGHGSVQLSAELDDPYTVLFGTPEGPELGDASDVVVDEGRIVTRGNFPVAGQEDRYVADPPAVQVDVSIPYDDRASRAAATATVAVLVTLLWVAVINLARIARSARRGQAFDGSNTARFRWIAAVVAAWPVVTAGAVAILNRTVEASPDVTVVRPGPAWWACLIVAVGLLALGEVFREGARLDEFDRSAI